LRPSYGKRGNFLTATVVALRLGAYRSACSTTEGPSMTKRYVHSTCLVFAWTLAACSQGRGGPSTAPEAIVNDTTTGEVACDEYLSLARSCIDKGRWGAREQRRSELVLVHRSLREAVQGASPSLNRMSLWSSALEADRLKKIASYGDLERVTKRATPLDLPPPRELCKSGIDQLPLDCQ
jgi:hypothetical protein